MGARYPLSHIVGGGGSGCGCQLSNGVGGIGWLEGLWVLGSMHEAAKDECNDHETGGFG